MVWNMPYASSLLSRFLRFLALRFRSSAQRKHRGTAEATLRAARATMKRKKYCVVSTVGADGPAARVLQPFPAGDDFEVWFGTSPASRKVTELRHNDAATLIYEDDARSACVVLVGNMQVVDAIDERRKRFMRLWWAFFPDGPEGDDYVLLRFVPHRIEVWDASRGITPAPFGLRAARLSRRDGTWGLAA